MIRASKRLRVAASPSAGNDDAALPAKTRYRTAMGRRVDQWARDAQRQDDGVFAMMHSRPKCSLTDLRVRLVELVQNKESLYAASAMAGIGSFTRKECELLLGTFEGEPKTHSGLSLLCPTEYGIYATREIRAGSIVAMAPNMPGLRVGPEGSCASISNTYIVNPPYMEGTVACRPGAVKPHIDFGSVRDSCVSLQLLESTGMNWFTEDYIDKVWHTQFNVMPFLFGRDAWSVDAVGIQHNKPKSAHFVVYRACRDIHPGEELSTAMGIGHWLAHVVNNDMRKFVGYATQYRAIMMLQYNAKPLNGQPPLQDIVPRHNWASVGPAGMLPSASVRLSVTHGIEYMPVYDPLKAEVELRQINPNKTPAPVCRLGAMNSHVPEDVRCFGYQVMQSIEDTRMGTDAEGSDMVDTTRVMHGIGTLVKIAASVIKEGDARRREVLTVDTDERSDDLQRMRAMLFSDIRMYYIHSLPPDMVKTIGLYLGAGCMDFEPRAAGLLALDDPVGTCVQFLHYAYKHAE